MKHYIPKNGVILNGVVYPFDDLYCDGGDDHFVARFTSIPETKIADVKDEEDEFVGAYWEPSESDHELFSRIIDEQMSYPGRCATLNRSEYGWTLTITQDGIAEEEDEWE